MVMNIYTFVFMRTSYAFLCISEIEVLDCDY